MNKEKLNKKIEELKQQFNQKLEVLKKEINSIEDEEIKKGIRQMPAFGKLYWFVDSGGVIKLTTWRNDEVDLYRFNIGNCFKTEQEALSYRENLLTKQALKDLALELNNSVEIDWENNDQFKTEIIYQFYPKNITCRTVIDDKSLGQIYCLDNNFINIAKDRIGEEKLIKLIKSGI